MASVVNSSPVDAAERESRVSPGWVLANVVGKDALTPEELNTVTQHTLTNWKEHVNPAFLTYRKSVADDYASIEWRAGTPGGSTLVDAAGKTYIDCLGGFGIYNCGHNHPTIVGAVQKQMSKQCLNSQELLDPLRAYCAGALASTAPGDLKYVFMTNSGTESVEHSLKFAMLATGRRHFIAVLGAFHGKTMGSVSATSKACFRKAFGGNLLPFTHVPVNDVAALAAVFESSRFTGNEIAGFIVEPVLGEGGIHVCSDEYLKAARALCTQYGAALIFDEVQSGMGRTGKMWACEHTGVAPDIMAVGKAFGGGVAPAGAVLGAEWVWERYFDNPFLFTTTFGGNPVSMTAALAAMHVLESEGLVQAAAAKGEWLLGQLRRLSAAFPGVLVDVRGRGLMIGLEFRDDAVGYDFSRGVFSRGVLLSGTLVNSRVLRVEPPLTITQEEMVAVLGVFEATLASMVAADASLAIPCTRRVLPPGVVEGAAVAAAPTPRREAAAALEVASAAPGVASMAALAAALPAAAAAPAMALLLPVKEAVPAVPVPAVSGGEGRDRAPSYESEAGTDASSLSGGTASISGESASPDEEEGEEDGDDAMIGGAGGEGGVGSDEDPTHALPPPLTRGRRAAAAPLAVVSSALPLPAGVAASPKAAAALGGGVGGVLSPKAAALTGGRVEPDFWPCN